MTVELLGLIYITTGCNFSLLLSAGASKGTPGEAKCVIEILWDKNKLDKICFFCFKGK